MERHGWHGVGLCFVTALSRDVTLEVRRTDCGEVYRFRRGSAFGAKREAPSSAATGTTVRFRPDSRIFTAHFTLDGVQRFVAEHFAGGPVRVLVGEASGPVVDDHEHEHTVFVCTWLRRVARARSVTCATRAGTMLASVGDRLEAAALLDGLSAEALARMAAQGVAGFLGSSAGRDRWTQLVGDDLLLVVHFDGKRDPADFVDAISLAERDLSYDLYGTVPEPEPDPPRAAAAQLAPDPWTPFWRKR
jgi:hypothetical protein